MQRRTELADKLEVVGRVFEITGMAELLDKLEPGINNVRFNSIVIQIAAKLMKEDQQLAEQIIAMREELTEEQVQELDDGAFALALRNAIITDVMGFFGSLGHTGGKPSPTPSTSTPPEA